MSAFDKRPTIFIGGGRLELGSNGRRSQRWDSIIGWTQATASARLKRPRFCFVLVGVSA